MIEITAFESFARPDGGWSYRRPAHVRRELTGTVALLVSVFDLQSGTAGAVPRTTHVRTVTTHHGRRSFTTPIRFETPERSKQLEVRVLCLEFDEEVDAESLLERPMPEFGEPLGDGHPEGARALFEDRWSVPAADDPRRGCEPGPGDRLRGADAATVGRDLAERGIRRVVSLSREGNRGVEHRRYHHRAEATDCALRIEYAA